VVDVVLVEVVVVKVVFVLVVLVSVVVLDVVVVDFVVVVATGGIGVVVVKQHSVGVHPSEWHANA
jgi:hypothetical protein